jgi:arylsulfatase A-like enzyme
MSVYGYNRRTTPNIERLAAEGAVFEHAYSNATWTKVSNPSFMTSQYISVLGGYTGDSGQLPSQATTMAQFMHDTGYQTGVFTTNSYCGAMSGFDRGVDWLREKWEESTFASARELHKDYWEWRKAHPGQPYWAHFQTTDVHWPWEPEAPFAGLFLGPELRLRYFKWEREVAKAAGLSYPTWPTPRRIPPDAFKKAGINHLEYFEDARCLNDEAMAHNDYQLGKLVERLKDSGEWEHTLLIIAADHGSWFGIGLYDPIPPLWGPRFRSYETHIPMIFVWPGHIASGQRLRQPVSLIDMLPTVLDLADIPAPEGLQGQSLAPLLLGEESWQSRPIIFDEFYVDPETGGLVGKIGVIDGRWGASLDIDHRPDEKRPPDYRIDPSYPYSRLGPPPPFPVLIYDVWEDPDCLVPLNEKRPDLVEKYTEFLEAKWKEHQELAQHFTRSEDSPLTPEQLRTLRSLGYIR